VLLFVVSVVLKSCEVSLVNHTTALFSSLQLVKRIFIDVFRPMPSRMGWMTSFLRFQGLSILIQSWILKELPCLFLSRVLAISLPLNMSSQTQLSSFFHPAIYYLFKLIIEPLLCARPTTLTALRDCPNSACGSKANAPDLMICFC